MNRSWIDYEYIMTRIGPQGSEHRRCSQFLVSRVKHVSLTSDDNTINDVIADIMTSWSDVRYYWTPILVKSEFCCIFLRGFVLSLSRLRFNSFSIIFSLVCQKKTFGHFFGQPFGIPKIKWSKNAILQNAKLSTRYHAGVRKLKAPSVQ